MSYPYSKHFRMKWYLVDERLLVRWWETQSRLWRVILYSTKTLPREILEVHIWKTTSSGGAGRWSVHLIFPVFIHSLSGYAVTNGTRQPCSLCDQELVKNWFFFFFLWEEMTQEQSLVEFLPFSSKEEWGNIKCGPWLKGKCWDLGKPENLGKEQIMLASNNRVGCY